jgi:coenzyme F420-reducing hydrogenase beta subunit
MSTTVPVPLGRPSHLQARRGLCADCGVCTYCAGEYYMVRDELWRKYGAGDGMLCVGCLERRVGRRLEGTDFNFLPLDENHEFCSRRLLRRLQSRRAPRDAPHQWSLPW